LSEKGSVRYGESESLEEATFEGSGIFVYSLTEESTDLLSSSSIVLYYLDQFYFFIPLFI